MPDPTPRKGVKTITITSGSGLTVTAGLVSATPFPPASREADSISAFDDPVATNVPRPLVTVGEMTLTFLDEGQAFADITAGVVSLSLKTAYWDGSTTAERTVSRSVFVKNVAPGGEVSVDGERKATVVLTVQPVAGGTLASAGIPGPAASGNS